MEHFIKILDLYGTEFHFYINKNPKYYTKFGGISTLISILLCFIVFLLLSLDDLRRINPITNISELKAVEYKKIQYEKNNLFLPWRITDDSEKVINHTGIFYPKIYYYYGIKDNKTNTMPYDYKIINSKPCSETSLKQLNEEKNFGLNMDGLSCINTDNLFLGGGWDFNYIYYIEFDLYLCKNGEDYNDSENCTSYKKLLDINNSTWFIEFFYPVVQFQPTNKLEPVMVFYQSFFYTLSLYNSKIDRMYFQEHIFEDDKGWIFSKHDNSSVWGVSSISGESYFIGENDIIGEGSTSRVYSLNYYLYKGVMFYKRKYKKLYEILGETFPVLKGVFSLIGFFVKIFGYTETNKKIGEYIFQTMGRKSLIKGVNLNLNLGTLANEFSPKPKKIRLNRCNTFSSKKKKDDMNNIDKNNIFELNSIKINPQSKIKNITEFKGGLSNKNNNKSENNISSEFFINKNQQFLPRNSLPHIYRFKFHKQEVSGPNIDNGKDNRSSISFPFFYYLIGYFISKINSGNYCNFVPKKFINFYTILTKFIDLSSYITLQKEFYLFKRTVLKNEERLFFETEKGGTFDYQNLTILSDNNRRSSLVNN